MVVENPEKMTKIVVKRIALSSNDKIKQKMNISYYNRAIIIIQR